MASGTVEVAGGRRAREWPFLGACALLFVATASGTVAWCGSMSEGMPMQGGWIMSMAWMRMPGQTWVGAATAFLGMWVMMMTAMMLPSLVPMLSTYRRAIRPENDAHLIVLSVLVGAGYFIVWTIVGAVAYPLGVGLAAAEMRWQGLGRSVPVATGIVIVLAGCVQLTAWKARRLACCRGQRTAPTLPPDARNAWRHGLQLGARCASCCSGFMMVLLAVGVMDLGTMAAVALGITVERFAPRPERAAHAIGAGLVAAGVLMIARAFDCARLVSRAI